MYLILCQGYLGLVFAFLAIIYNPKINIFYTTVFPLSLFSIVFLGILLEV